MIVTTHHIFKIFPKFFKIYHFPFKHHVSYLSEYYFVLKLMSFLTLSTFFSTFQNSIFLNLIQEIEPLDLSRIQKDVPIGTIDAMKRTISSMLGLLPSDRYQVIVDASWESLSKLLLSSIMTGYVKLIISYEFVDH